MTSLTYRVADDVFRKYPGYRLGVLVFSGVSNEGSNAAIESLLRVAEELARKAVQGNVAEFPVVAAWRDAYRNFGAKPSEHRSSIEALLRRVVKPDTLPTINPLVDIGSIVSLTHLVPAGVHPIRHQETNIELRLARTEDRFQATADQQPEDVLPGEVVLADQFEILTRRWTWRQSVNTRMQGSTTRAFFNVDSLGVTTDATLEAAMDEAVRLVGQFCGGKLVHAGVLAAANPEFRCAVG